MEQSKQYLIAEEAKVQAAAEAIRELFSWQVFQAAHDKLSAGDWAYVAALKAIEAYKKEPSKCLQKRKNPHGIQ